mmetsp:Transcript_23035/g.53850  ORF Transcript_23035/g.53850 Transcript_23035/m.53850 type:complete len:209 (-) Transcript_23035:190-816(-)
MRDSVKGTLLFSFRTVLVVLSVIVAYASVTNLFEIGESSGDDGAGKIPCAIVKRQPSTIRGTSRDSVVCFVTVTVSHSGLVAGMGDTPGEANSWLSLSFRPCDEIQPSSMQTCSFVLFPGRRKGVMLEEDLVKKPSTASWLSACGLLLLALVLFGWAFVPMVVFLYLSIKLWRADQVHWSTFLPHLNVHLESVPTSETPSQEADTEIV